MLSDNLARQQQAAGELLKPLPARSNRRRSDYLFLLFTGNLLAVLAYVLLRNYPLAFVSLVGFVALYNTAIVWILFFVMSRY
jgi:hypothetical protein